MATVGHCGTVQYDTGKTAHFSNLSGHNKSGQLGHENIENWQK